MRARPKVDEARDILANVVVCHVPVVHYNFQQKVQLGSPECFFSQWPNVYMATLTTLPDMLLRCKRNALCPGSRRRAVIKAWHADAR